MLNLDSEKVLPPSYPIPFTRTNQGPQVQKKHAGFFATGTATNPSDPSSMFAQGKPRNAIFNP